MKTLLKKVLFVALSAVMVVDAWGKCELTTEILNNTEKTMDEYLYPSSAHYENYTAGYKGEVTAYICGYNHCSENEEIKLTEAKIATGNVCAGDCIFKCVNQGGRMHWVEYKISPLCTAQEKNFEYKTELGVWKIKDSFGGQEYCAKLDDVNAREVSRDKVNFAMSVLNGFKQGQEASVWKNADGKFNTARLVSDATAGVVLGTAGGLISNKLIKKNQVKKGFEGIGCYVAGQEVADYGDQFTVGMM